MHDFQKYTCPKCGDESHVWLPEGASLRRWTGNFSIKKNNTVFCNYCKTKAKKVD